MELRKQPQIIQQVESGINLTNNSVLRFILTNKYVQITVQSLSVALFAIAMYAAFWGPADGSNFALISFWGLWWSIVMIISLLLLGRIWCYACPMGAISRFLQRFSLNLRFPTYHKQWVIGGLSILLISAITFMFARLPLYKFMFVNAPAKTGIYFLVILILVVIVSMLFERRAFCRYICPITSALTVTAKLSLIELVHEKNTGTNCMTAEFPGNYLSGDHRCIYCMKCTVDQPQAAVKAHFRWPGAAAVKEKMPLMDEAIIALIIFAIFPVDHVLGKVLREALEPNAVPDFFARSVPYFTTILATILAFALVNRIAARWSNLSPKSTFTRFAYAYLPLGISWQVGAMIESLLKNGGELLNSFAAGLGITLNLPVSWASPGVVAAWANFRYTGLLWVGVFWGAVIAWLIARDIAKEKPLKAFLPHLIFMFVTTYIVMVSLAIAHAGHH